MRRIGETWVPGMPYRDRPGVYGILIGPGGILCVDQDGELQLPGGGVDPGEQPMAALHREVREETGWRIAEARLLGRFQRFAYLPEYGFWARKVQMIYVARAVRDLGPPEEPGHHPIWMTPEKAQTELDVAGDRWALRRARRLGWV